MIFSSCITLPLWMLVLPLSFVVLGVGFLLAVVAKQSLTHDQCLDEAALAQLKLYYWSLPAGIFFAILIMVLILTVADVS
jgi:hypothetical protein